MGIRENTGWEDRSPVNAVEAAEFLVGLQCARLPEQSTAEVQLQPDSPTRLRRAIDMDSEQLIIRPSDASISVWEM